MPPLLTDATTAHSYSLMPPLLTHATTAHSCIHCSLMRPPLTYTTTAYLCHHYSLMPPLLTHATTTHSCHHGSLILTHSPPLLTFPTTSHSCHHYSLILPLLTLATIDQSYYHCCVSLIPPPLTHSCRHYSPLITTITTIRFHNSSPYTQVLYSYLEKCPSHLFYDFSCGFSEYSLNREPRYFAALQYWIDMFHFCRGHNSDVACSTAFCPYRNPELKEINDSVAEQYHAFIDGLKHHVKNMSQLAYMFYYQYSIRLWNRRKAEFYAKLLKAELELAVEGEQ